MIFKNFSLNIIFRLVLIVFTSILLVYLIFQTEFYVSAAIVGISIIIQMYYLLRFVDKTNRRLSTFLESIRHNDFTSSFSDAGSGQSFDSLNRAFNEVIGEFSKTKAREEEQYHYLQTVLQHVKVGIIAFRKDGMVDMFNNAAKRLMKFNNLKHITELQRLNEELPESLLKLKSGDNILFKTINENELQQLSINASEFRMRGEEYLLISIQNIHAELEEKEIESWQKLIRVLTHEIMNSITPISSLASTVRDLLIDDEEQPLPPESMDEDTIESVHEALAVIQTRSQGLLNFVEVYRNLTRIPKPNFRYISLLELFARVDQLMKPKINLLGVHCEKSVSPEDLKLTADPDLLEQVLINLALNAIHAVKDVENPQIRMQAFVDKNSRIVIQIIDNGYGIPHDLMDKIFLPFFTSKKEGSGIGLSLSRQIMHLHKGKIHVTSEPQKQTCFTLSF